MKYIKSPYSKYLKKLQCSNPNGASVRAPYGSVNELITHKQFKLVLPMVLKDNISGKGSSMKPGKKFKSFLVFHLFLLRLSLY